jgi:hypothetical protein
MRLNHDGAAAIFAHCLRHSPAAMLYSKLEA